MKKEVICLNEKRNVTLTAYVQEVGGEFANIKKRPAILVLPGGGYQMCSDREADPIAFPYLNAGYQVFILRYSVREDAVWPTPLEDYEQAMERIQKECDAWNVYPDKIAVIGFSAGGHLAAAAATMAKNRPSAAILGYAVLNEAVKGCNPSAPSLIGEVDEKTCPCFLFASRTDNVVPVASSLQFMLALDEAGISFESHIYAYGPHGFSTCNSAVQDMGGSFCTRIPHWVEDSIGWLRDVLGDFGKDGMTKPACKPVLNADKSGILCVDCTLECLMGNPDSKSFLEELLKQMNTSSENPAAGDIQPEEILRMARKMTLRDVLAYGNTPVEIVNQVDGRLREMTKKLMAF